MTKMRNRENLLYIYNINKWITKTIFDMRR